MPPNAVEVEELRKSYGAVEAVRGISFTVAEGEVFALLGPNGAGKTTTVEILEGFRRRDGGRVSVLGFDPGARRNAWDVIKGLKDLGKTVFLTSHSMDEVQFLADRVVIISAGRIVAEGTPDTLAGREKAAALIRFKVPANTTLPAAISSDLKTNGDFVEIQTQDPTRALHELTSWAVRQNLSLDGLEVTRPSLEDVYLQITEQADAARTPA